MEIEALRLGDRLKVEQAIDPGLLKALVPPFCLQPLVENAVQHGLHSRAGVGRLQLMARPAEGGLELRVSDDGYGVPPTEIERRFFAEGPRIHALGLLRRRLQGLFGRCFELAARSELGAGTTVTLRLPLPKRFETGPESSEAIRSGPFELASN